TGPDRVWAGDFEQRSGYEAVARRLDKGQKMPRALFCANDLMALGAIAALRERGLQVPEDVAVMGFDDLPLAAASVPPLTTVRQPIQAMGAIAFRMVVRLAQGEALESERIVLDTELVGRGSAYMQPDGSAGPGVASKRTGPLGAPPATAAQAQGAAQPQAAFQTRGALYKFRRFLIRTGPAYLFILPAVSAILLVHYIPMAGGILVAFKDIN